MNHVEAATRLCVRLGDAWTMESMAWLKKTYPDGVAEDQLDAIVQQLQAVPSRPALRVVGGNS
ncbi:hypothetical protein [Pseudomonas aeruginosa]|nr:hypothetical protein [Pseudomonas aeruginosa]